MKSANIGSSFDDLLADEALLVGATAVAVKRIIAWQIVQAMRGAEDNQKKPCAENAH